MKNVLFSGKAFEEYTEWKGLDSDILGKINGLLFDIARHPFKGLGKPEPLKGNWAGYWSRRITQEHRLVYKVENETIHVVKCFGHY